MFKQHAVLIKVTIGIITLVIATFYYPGGSQYDKNAVGFDWENNYLTNLFGNTAVNGLTNTARPIAMVGMLVLCVGFMEEFIYFSKKIPSKTASGIIKYFGIAAMVFALLAMTPYHDTAVILASTCALVSLFYITVFLFKSRLNYMKVLSVICLLCFYGSNYMYYTRSYLALLPIMQKITILLVVIWIIALEYFTTAADFRSAQKPLSQKV
jgi:hypothetical protein